MFVKAVVGHSGTRKLKKLDSFAGTCAGPCLPAFSCLGGSVPPTGPILPLDLKFPSGEDSNHWIVAVDQWPTLPPADPKRLAQMRLSRCASRLPCLSWISLGEFELD